MKEKMNYAIDTYLFKLIIDCQTNKSFRNVQKCLPMFWLNAYSDKLYGGEDNNETQPEIKQNQIIIACYPFCFPKSDGQICG